MNLYFKQKQEEVFEIIKTQLKFKDKSFSKLVFEYPKRQGKYLRANLLILSTKLFKGSLQPAQYLASTIQLMEDYLLVHDDLLDNSPIRRSKPSLPRLYGYNKSLIAGDMLNVCVYESLLKNFHFFSYKINYEIFKLITSTLKQTLYGQYLEEVYKEKPISSIKEKDYYNLIDHKTFYYSFFTPLKLGLLISENKKYKSDVLLPWSKYLSRAFQLRNDLKGLEEDIIEGKKTLILIYLFKACNSSEKEAIKNIYKHKEIKKTEKNYILKLIKEKGIINKIETIIENYLKQAKEKFDYKINKKPDLSLKAKKYFIEIYLKLI